MFAWYKFLSMLRKRVVAVHLLHAVTIDSFPAMLFPLVESVLPEDTIRPWECYRTNTKVGLSEIETLSVSPNSSISVNYLQVSLEFIKVGV